MKTKLFLFTVILFSFGMIFNCSAAVLYVSTTGLDTNPGTQASPFKTILKASQVATAGSTVHVASGIYTGGFQTTKAGTVSARIIYMSDSKYGAKITAPSNSTKSVGWDNRGAYVTIDGFEVDGTPSTGTMWTVGINVAGAGDIVSNCLVHHIYNTGVANSSGGAGILLDSWYGFNNMQALNNIVHHVGPSTGGSSWYHGIYQTATGSIKNNIVYANAGGGIHMWHDANNIIVANNTSFGNGSGFLFGGGDYVNTTGPADYVIFANNIAFDNTGIGFDQEGQYGTHNVWTNNLSYQNGTNWRLNGNPAHTGDITANPQFVNYIRTGGGDYHLKSTSPAIDKGIATYAPAMDFDGKTRGTMVDIGAYEYFLTTGISEEKMESKSVNLYPNPFSTNFNINISSEIILKDAVIKMYDVCGKEVKVVSIDNNEIIVDRDELQNGIYFYQIINNSVSIGKGKLVIQ